MGLLPGSAPLYWSCAFLFDFLINPQGVLGREMTPPHRSPTCHLFFDFDCNGIFLFSTWNIFLLYRSIFINLFNGSF
jgi:hypothetical protein